MGDFLRKLDEALDSGVLHTGQAQLADTKLPRSVPDKVISKVIRTKGRKAPKREA